MTHPDLLPLANHLWQSTICAGVVWILTALVRKNRAEVRFRLWLVASIKFLIPFSLLVSVGSHFGWRTASSVPQPHWSIVMSDVSRPFTAAFTLPPTSDRVIPLAEDPVPILLIGVWLCGFAVGVIFWVKCWRHSRAARRNAISLAVDFPIPVLSSASAAEPGVFGIWRPVLLLPEGIAERLTPDQLVAILVHEKCHVQRRDNLTGAIHLAIEAIFWFHPLIWWIRSRLLEERERACDEAVLQLGSEPQTYAEGILNVCKFYVASPLACASGITASNLRKRIEEIMASRVGIDLDWKRRLVLIAIGTAAVTAPLVVGLMNARPLQAQSQPAAPVSFEAASVKPNRSGEQGYSTNVSPGMFRAANVPLELLIEAAYSVRSFQIADGPGWIHTERYDVTAKSAGKPSVPQLLSMLQALLENRFNLKVHRETKELPVYILSIAKGGLKMRSSSCTPVDPLQRSADRQRCDQMKYGSHGLNRTIDAVGGDVGSLAATLSERLGRTVLDRSGLTEPYDFHLEWLPDAVQDRNPEDDPGKQAMPVFVHGASIFSALQEQLGLKLETGKGPVEVVVIDYVERPSEN